MRAVPRDSSTVLRQTATLVALAACGCVSAPPEETLSRIQPRYVQEYVRGLYSGGRKQRIAAIVKLGACEKRALEAVPYLIDMLGDRKQIRNPHINWTIEESRRGQTLAVMATKHWTSVFEEASGALFAISGHHFDDDFFGTGKLPSKAMWRKWWEENRPK